MTAALSTHGAELEAAYRHAAALTAALPRHACWCGEFGPHRFAKGGAWFCGAHIKRDEKRVAARGIGADEAAIGREVAS